MGEQCASACVFEWRLDRAICLARTSCVSLGHSIHGCIAHSRTPQSEGPLGCRFPSHSRKRWFGGASPVASMQIPLPHGKARPSLPCRTTLQVSVLRVPLFSAGVRVCEPRSIVMCERATHSCGSFSLLAFFFISIRRFQVMNV